MKKVKIEEVCPLCGEKFVYLCSTEGETVISPLYRHLVDVHQAKCSGMMSATVLAHELKKYPTVQSIEVID